MNIYQHATSWAFRGCGVCKAAGKSVKTVERLESGRGAEGAPDLFTLKIGTRKLTTKLSLVKFLFISLMPSFITGLAVCWIYCVTLRFMCYFSSGRRYIIFKFHSMETKIFIQLHCISIML